VIPIYPQKTLFVGGMETPFIRMHLHVYPIIDNKEDSQFQCFIHQQSQ